MRRQIIFVGFVVGLAIPSAAQKSNQAAGGVYDALGVPTAVADNAGNKFAGYLYGVVTKLDKDTMVLAKTKAGVDQTFKFDKKTKFIRDGKDSSLKSLKIGDAVWVNIEHDKKTGEPIARKVVSGVYLMPSF